MNKNIRLEHNNTSIKTLNEEKMINKNIKNRCKNKNNNKKVGKVPNSDITEVQANERLESLSREQDLMTFESSEITNKNYFKIQLSRHDAFLTSPENVFKGEGSLNKV